MCMYNVILALSAPVEGSDKLYKLTGVLPTPREKSDKNPSFITVKVPKQTAIWKIFCSKYRRVVYNVKLALY